MSAAHFAIKKAVATALDVATADDALSTAASPI